MKFALLPKATERCMFKWPVTSFQMPPPLPVAADPPLMPLSTIDRSPAL